MEVSKGWRWPTFRPRRQVTTAGQRSQNAVCSWRWNRESRDRARKKVVSLRVGVVEILHRKLKFKQPTIIVRDKIL